MSIAYGTPQTGNRKQGIESNRRCLFLEIFRIQYLIHVSRPAYPGTKSFISALLRYQITNRQETPVFPDPALLCYRHHFATETGVTLY